MPQDPEKKLQKVYEICKYCRGIKARTLPLGPVPCEYCNETGMKLVGYIETDK